MDALDELSELLTGGSRVVVIARHDLDLSKPAENALFVLKMAEGSLAAGGRGGGFGERRMVSVSFFRCAGGVWEKPFETVDPAKVEEFEVPYYVSRIPLTLRDGRESMGYGVVEAELVERYLTFAK